MKILLSKDQLRRDKAIVIYGRGSLADKLMSELEREELHHLVIGFLDSFECGEHGALPVHIAETKLRQWDPSTDLVLATSHGDPQRLVEHYLSQDYFKYIGDKLTPKKESELEVSFEQALTHQEWLTANTCLDFFEQEKRFRLASKLDKEINKQLKTPPYLMSNYENLFRIRSKRTPLEKDRKEDTPDLIIYDRIFPSPHCSFAYQEFDAYLKHFPKSKIILTGTDLASSGDLDGIERFKASYCEKEGIAPARLELINSQTSFKAKHFYTLFLRGIYSVLNLLQKHNTPFSFTLYSGGEFGLNCPTSDRKLKKVLSSKLFSHVIVVEPVTRDYLIEKFGVPKEKIKYIFGPITNAESIKQTDIRKLRWGYNKTTLDICFIANKHMPDGSDKGWDHFVEVVKILSLLPMDISFHVVGGFSDSDLPSGCDLPIKFYGHQPDSFFPKFHEKMDIILSPCRPFVLAPGAFDGKNVDRFFQNSKAACSVPYNALLSFTYSICLPFTVFKNGWYFFRSTFTSNSAMGPSSRMCTTSSISECMKAPGMSTVTTLRLSNASITLVRKTDSV